MSKDTVVNKRQIKKEWENIKSIPKRFMEHRKQSSEYQKRKRQQALENEINSFVREEAKKVKKKKYQREMDEKMKTEGMYE